MVDHKNKFLFDYLLNDNITYLLKFQMQNPGTIGLTPSKSISTKKTVFYAGVILFRRLFYGH